MSITGVDGNLLRKMIISGANELSKNRRAIDALNVFPVPDGDTGINMSLTVQAAAKEVYKLSTPNISDVAKAASSGSLRGARGNSGVIMSQLFRGFAKGLEGKAVANGEELANALAQGMETAYKAVMKPKEGTILTIARALGEYAQELAYDTNDIEKILSETIRYANAVLEKTTQMLPELRQAGVVDAGGKGLLLIFEGAYAGMYAAGELFVQPLDDASESQPSAAGAYEGEIKFGYCTEFFIGTKDQSPVTEAMEDGLKRYLSSIGDSIVVVSDEDIIKVHVHSNHPGSVLEKALSIGSLSNVKIDNMRLQHSSLINFSTEEDKKDDAADAPEAEWKDTGFVAVSTGSGLKELFKNIGADVVIEGGQSMNPSTEDILRAIGNINADHVVVLPNNKNIILAAEQAKAMIKDKSVYVLPTKTIPQGISALINYIQLDDIESNIATMTEAVKKVKTGQVTYAVRDTVIDGKEIKEGDTLCMLEGKIEIVAEDTQSGAKALADRMMEGEAELISVFYGEEVTEDMAGELESYLSEKYPDCEIELYNGAQPLYYYIISVE